MKIHVRNIDGNVRLELEATSPNEMEGLYTFVETVNGGPIAGTDPNDEVTGPKNVIFDTLVRIESVGLDDNSVLNSITFETMPPTAEEEE